MTRVQFPVGELILFLFFKAQYRYNQHPYLFFYYSLLSNTRILAYSTIHATTQLTYLLHAIMCVLCILWTLVYYDWFSNSLWLGLMYLAGRKWTERWNGVYRVWTCTVPVKSRRSMFVFCGKAFQCVKLVEVRLCMWCVNEWNTDPR